jgi:hypothetical protein
LRNREGVRGAWGKREESGSLRQLMKFGTQQGVGKWREGEGEDYARHYREEETVHEISFVRIVSQMHNSETRTYEIRRLNALSFATHSVK